MRVTFYVAAVLFIVALYIYFFGTPLVANATGLSPRSVSLGAGLAIAVLGFAAMMLAKLAVKRARDE